MTTVDGKFDDGPELHPLGDIFARQKRNPILDLPLWARGIPPANSACATKAELAKWFEEFGLACRFARVNPCG